MKYYVVVEKRMYASGYVEIESDTPEQAVELIQRQIDTGKLQTASIEWDEPQYEDCSFTTTEDVN